MINQDGFKLLESLYPETTNFAVFLLSAFDLRAFTTLHPEKLIKFGTLKGYGQDRTEKNLIKKIDDLVKFGFLEYGPFVRGWNNKKTPTVRIRQRFLLTNRQVGHARAAARDRAERVDLLTSSLQMPALRSSKQPEPEQL